MAYEPQTWAPGAAGGTPLTAERLNKLEQGLAATATVADEGGGPHPLAVTEEITDGVQDGVNTHFRTTYAMVAGTLALYRNGLAQIPLNCYCEIDGDPKLFKTATPPQATDVLTVIYRTLDEVVLPGEVEVLPGTDRGVQITGSRQIRKGSIGLDRLAAEVLDLIAAGGGQGGGGESINAATQAALDGKESLSRRGAADGYAPLDASQLIPSIHLPSYVDDVLEFDSFAALPAPGVKGKIYVTLDDNRTWRWSGTAYQEISPSPGSTDAIVEGAANLYYTTARVDTRVQAGILAERSAARTITNTRIVPRVAPPVTNVTSWTIDADSFDYAENNGIAANITINKPTGTPVPYQLLGLVIVPATTTKNITWDTLGFESSSVTLPGSTGTSRKDVLLMWNPSSSRWRCVRAV
jgi:hypothetical protein